MNSPIKPTLRTEIIPLLIVAVCAVASFYFYANFPDRVPTHWNIAGQVDGWSSRGFAAFFFPILFAGMYLLFLGLPYLDPRKDKYQQFAKVYHMFKALILAVMGIIYFVVGFAGMGYPIAVERVIPGSIGIFMIVLGNYMGKIRPNWFMGIRTPWTMSNDEVWTKTHRLGGLMFVLFGIVLLITPFMPQYVVFPLFIFGVIGASLVPMVYSYVIYRKINKHS